jgi:hypothetical protein
MSTLLQDILHPSHHLLNVLLQIANKLGLSNKKKNGVLTEKPEGSRPLGRCRCRWEDSIDMDLTQVGYEGVAWIHLAESVEQCGLL